MNASVHVDPEPNLGCKREGEVELESCGSGGAPAAAAADGVGLADGSDSGIWRVSTRSPGFNSILFASHPHYLPSCIPSQQIPKSRFLGGGVDGTGARLPLRSTVAHISQCAPKSSYG